MPSGVPILVLGIATSASRLARRAAGTRGEVQMAKYHSRPSAQYRYEHYDPR
jgi:hypothetical protein